MKSFSEFGQEMRFAVENLMLEAEGFGEYAKKRRKKKKEYLSKRSEKIKALSRRSELWSGLE